MLTKKTVKTTSKKAIPTKPKFSGTRYNVETDSKGNITKIIPLKKK